MLLAPIGKIARTGKSPIELNTVESSPWPD